MAIQITRKNSQLPCEKHNAREGASCWDKRDYNGKVCGSRWRKCKNLP